jgi:hypothetical protein
LIPSSIILGVSEGREKSGFSSHAATCTAGVGGLVVRLYLMVAHLGGQDKSIHISDVSTGWEGV